VTTRFAILRHESGGYSSRGPVAVEMTLEEARKEVARLKTSFPHQDFVIMGEIGTVFRSDRVTVRIEAPELANELSKRPRPTYGRNVFPLDKVENG
jgi:hypothetical protein